MTNGKRLHCLLKQTTQKVTGMRGKISTCTGEAARSCGAKRSSICFYTNYINYSSRLCRPMCGRGCALPETAGFVIGLCPSSLALRGIIEVEPLCFVVRSRIEGA